MMSSGKRKFENGSSIESDPTIPAPAGAEPVALTVDAVALINELDEGSAIDLDATTAPAIGANPPRGLYQGGPDGFKTRRLFTDDQIGGLEPLPAGEAQLIGDDASEIAESNPVGPLLRPLPSLQWWWRLPAAGDRGFTFADSLAENVGLDLERHERDHPDLDTFTVKRDGRLLAEKVNPDQLWFLLHAYDLGSMYGTFEAIKKRDEELRPDLYLFSRLMESRLRANEDKGGYEKTPGGFLLKPLIENLQVVESMFYRDYSTFKLRDQANIELTRRLVNIANFSMMVAHSVGGLQLDAETIQDHYTRQEIGVMPKAMDYDHRKVGYNLSTFVEMMRLCAVKFEGVQSPPENALQEARDMVYRLDARWHQNEPARNAAYLAGVATRVFVAARAMGALRLNPSEIETFLH